MKYKYYIIAIISILLVGACSDDIEQEPRDVDFCVRAAWQNGLDGGKATRALSTTDILAGGMGDIAIHTDDYPATITVKCMKDAAQVGEDFTLTKGTGLCTEHTEYWQYTPSVIYKDKKIERDNLTFTFSATIDEGDELEGEANKESITEKASSGQRHMLVTLHHTKALLRFAFKVSEKYSKVRYIKVTGINLNGNDCYVKPNAVLAKDSGDPNVFELIAYAYIDPSAVTTSTVNTLACTYNIYDKDSATDADLTRKDVVAQNKFTLNSIKDSNDSNVSKIKPGYYYDLHVTLNPDYLYVLSEHDNKHITIN